MKPQQQVMSPQDIVVLLKIITYGDAPWFQLAMADELYISQSEISKSLARSKFAGLLDTSGKKVSRLALMEFLKHGIRHVFPVRPGALVRGICTAHSAPPLNNTIASDAYYVWPSASGDVRGQCIIPLYASIPKAAKSDIQLYELLALTDALRIGRARERNLAVGELEKRIL